MFANVLAGKGDKHKPSHSDGRPLDEAEPRPSAPYAKPRTAPISIIGDPLLTASRQSGALPSQRHPPVYLAASSCVCRTSRAYHARSFLKKSIQALKNSQSRRRISSTTQLQQSRFDRAISCFFVPINYSLSRTIPDPEAHRG